MKISTLNINSVNAHLPAFLSWLQAQAPDIVLLQEIKTEYNNFPFLELNALGYQAALVGQKSYNGVAVLSKYPLEVTAESLPEAADFGARYIEALVFAPTHPISVASVYMPNGNPVTEPQGQKTEKFKAKLSFMSAFYKYVQKRLLSNERMVFGGDFNVILTPNDVYNPTLFEGNALYLPMVQKRLKALEYLGLTDAFRALDKTSNGYTYFDYGKAFEQDFGLRIDYLYLSPAMADGLISVAVDKSLRAAPKTSDHAPLTAEFHFPETLF